MSEKPVEEWFDLGDIGLSLIGTGIAEKMGEIYPLDQNKFVLEPGCGSGKFGVFYALKYGCNTTLLDIDPAVLERALRLLRTVEAVTNRRLPVVLQQGDIMKLPYVDSTFDLVYNEGVIEHWTGDLRVKCLEEMTRVSRDCVMVITNDAEGERSRQRALETAHHYEGMPEKETPYTEAELKLALEQVGLKHVEVIRFQLTLTQEYLLGVGGKGS